MNIILVSSRRPTAKTITIGRGQLAAGCFGFLVILFLLAGLMNYAALRYAAESRDASVFGLFPQQASEDADRDQAYLRDNIDAMSTRLGELQAQILRLDTLGERVARLAGFKPQELSLGKPAARGGAEPSSPPSTPLAFEELARQLDFLSRAVEDRGDRLGLLDSILTQKSVDKQLLPSVMPVSGGVFTSNFGWRLDPFNGRNSFHEGIDFMAAPGTSILAAAAGVVVKAEYHPQYGNMIELDHGNGLVTLYAHCSRLRAKVGDVVKKGAVIGEVGSSGRATGPHLHFEVRHRDVAQNPARFLRLAG
jgi:murein DD-endopeptidase MepM/ murein hydrolase activator NlpD